MRKREDVTAKELRRLLHYDPLTGIFTRLVGTGKGAHVGAAAGTMNGQGYMLVSVKCRQYRAHRLAWLYMTGSWPQHEVGHRNGKRDDNRWENLFDAPPTQHRESTKRTPERRAMLDAARQRACPPEQAVTIEKLRLRVSYNPDTGELRWRASVPVSEFVDEHAARIWHGKFAGKPIAKRNPKGYVIVSISVDLKTHYLQGHRVAWALMTGSWPEQQIDHANCDPGDNRWSNLRQATHQQNQWNRMPGVRNTSGVRGVHRSKSTGKWVAQIGIDRRTRHLGAFDDLSSAAAARRQAELAQFGKFAPQL